MREKSLGRGMGRRFSGFIPMTIIPLTLPLSAWACDLEKPSSHSPAHDSLATAGLSFLHPCFGCGSPRCVNLWLPFLRLGSFFLWREGFDVGGPEIGFDVELQEDLGPQFKIARH